MRASSRPGSNLRSSFLIFSLFAIVILDQTTKFAAWQMIPVTCNRGMGFGLNVSGPFGVLLSALILAVLAYFFNRENDHLKALSYVLVIGGGFSNLIDRILLDCIRDFINIGIFPSFNIADSAISFGVVLLFYSTVLRKKEEHDSGNI